ncbi:MAG: PAS domain-containing protein [Candidatus Omnitrophica bacterium]|nr:PAS domain-containing protein [Candidatus Omnitrophota bacterium]
MEKKNQVQNSCKYANISRDLGVIAICAIVALVLASIFHLNETFEKWVIALHERIPIHELLILSPVLIFSLLILYICRLKSSCRIERELEKHQNDLESVINERTLELRAASAFNENILRNMQDAFYVIDLKGRLLKWNEVFAKITGYSDDEIFSMKLTDFFAEEDGRRMAIATEVTLNTGAECIEADIISKDGKHIPYEFTSSLLKDPRDNPIAISGSGRDLTERKKAEEKRKIFFHAVDDAYDGFIMTDMDGKVTYANKAAANALGYTQDELANLNIANVILHPKLAKIICEKVVKKESWNGEIKGKNKAGQERDVILSVSLIKDEKGNPVGMMVAFMDITERKRNEEALKDSQLRVRAILDQTFQFIGLMTTDGILVDTNKASLDFAGIEESAALNKPFWETVWWTHSAEMQGKLRDAVKKAAAGEFVRFEATHVSKDGHLHYVDFSLKPVKDETGKVIFIIPESRDITEYKEMAEEKSRLAAIIEATSDFVGIADIKGKVLYVNGSGRKVAGISEDENITDTKIADFHPYCALKIVMNEGIPTATREGIWSGETALLSRDGKIIPVSQVLIVHKTPAGTPDYVSTIMRILPERKKTKVNERETL